MALLRWLLIPCALVGALVSSETVAWPTERQALAAKLPSIAPESEIRPDPVLLLAEDAESFDLFGSSLGVTERHLAVGARWADALRGAVYVYQRLPPSIGGQPRFLQVARLTGGAASKTFGWSVSMDGLVVAVGAEGEDNGSGAAYLFDLAEPGGSSSSSGVRISAPPGARHFGRAVAVSDRTLVVASERADLEYGAAYVFSRPDGGWGSLDVSRFTKLISSPRQFLSRFGRSVAIDGKSILVGAPGFDDGRGIGAVLVFEPPPGGWTGDSEVPINTLAGPSGASLGAAIASTGDLLAVAAPNLHDEAGMRTGGVFLFRRPADGWGTAPGTPIASLTPSDGEDHAAFGISVAAWKDSVLVGAPGDPVLGFEPPGAVYVFERPPSGWEEFVGHESTKLVPPGGEMGDRFGFSVAMTDSALFSGAITDSVASREQGAVYVYGIIGRSLVEIPVLSRVGIGLLISLLSFIALWILRR